MIVMMPSEKALEHYRNPRNVGELEDADGVGIYISDICGDITRFWIKVEDGKITDVRFKTFGCWASIASASILTEMVKGKTIEEARRIMKEEIADALGGLPEPKIHCSVLADDALDDSIYDYLSRRGLPIPKDLVEKHEKVRVAVKRLEDMGFKVG